MMTITGLDLTVTAESDDAEEIAALLQLQRRGVKIQVATQDDHQTYGEGAPFRVKLEISRARPDSDECKALMTLIQTAAV